MEMAAQLRDSFYSCKSLEHTGQRHLSICLKWMDMDLWERLVSLFQCTVQHCKTFTAMQLIPEFHTSEMEKIYRELVQTDVLQALGWTELFNLLDLKILVAEEQRLSTLFLSLKWCWGTKETFLPGCVL